MSCKCASSLQKMIYSRYFAARYAKKIILAMLNLTICPKNSNYLVSKIQDFSCIFGELAKKASLWQLQFWPGQVLMLDRLLDLLFDMFLRWPPALRRAIAGHG